MSEFVDYLGEVFERFGPIKARNMFGGHGIYHRWRYVRAGSRRRLVFKGGTIR